MDQAISPGDSAWRAWRLRSFAWCTALPRPPDLRSRAPLLLRSVDLATAGSILWWRSAASSSQAWMPCPGLATGVINAVVLHCIYPVIKRGVARPRPTSAMYPCCLFCQYSICTVSERSRNDLVCRVGDTGVGISTYYRPGHRRLAVDGLGTAGIGPSLPERCGSGYRAWSFGVLSDICLRPGSVAAGSLIAPGSQKTSDAPDAPNSAS